MERFAVVILNWNASADTIQCLRSIFIADPTAVPVVVDNGSQDDSVRQILFWCQSLGIRTATGSAEDLCATRTEQPPRQLLLVRSRDNLGFAKGSNLGLRVVAALEFPSTVFLNNDTVVAPGALSFLVDKLRVEPELYAAVPQLRISGTDQIWNCGGTISRLGYRRYHFGGRKLTSTSLPKRIVCSFFTGCCFAVRTREFCARGGFSERFFFGEEDFELALWMLDNGKTAACFTDAVIDHKVSASISKSGRARSSTIYLYYLNRLIHMRLRFGVWRWRVWLCLYLPYIIQLLYRTSRLSTADLLRFVTRLVRDARRYDGVTHELFTQIMR